MKNRICLLPLFLALLGGCGDKENGGEPPLPPDPGPEEEQTTIILATDWSNRGTGIDIPASYTVRVGDYTATASGETNTIDNVFPSATYRAYIYNTPDGIRIDGTSASVDPADSPDGGEWPYVAHAPGWFFSCALTAEIQEKTDHRFTALMRQQVRQVSFAVRPAAALAGKVASVAGWLGGVAGAMDIDSEARSAPSAVALAFERQDDGTWKATVRLLGFAGETQPLTITVRFTDDGPDDITDTTDIHDQIDGFFDGDETEITLDTEIDIEETTSEPGFTTTISGWKIINDNIHIN